MDEAAVEQCVRQLFGGPIQEFVRLSSPAQSDLFKAVDDAGKEYVVKRFDDVPLFWIEMRALVALQSTQRVCKIVHASFELPGFLSPDFGGPFLIVKPFFRRMLDRDVDPLVAAERAIQLVDISRRFFQANWRDLDGGSGNDGLDATGHVVRFDLDAAVSPASVSSKLQRQLVGRSGEGTLVSVKESLAHLFAEKEELTAISIRVSRFLLRQEASQWPLFDRVVEGNGYGDREAWTAAWRTALQEGIDLGRVGFNVSESRALASLLFETISSRRYAMTLDDLHNGMHGIVSGACRRVLRSSGDPPQRLRALLSTMPSLSVPDAAGPVPMARESLHAYKTIARTTGGAWRATAKGTDWRCQDLVITSRETETPTAVLADGASFANGAEAIVEVERWWNAGTVDRISGDAAASKRGLVRAFQQLHESLLQAGSRLGSSCETTLVLARLVETAREAPMLLIGAFGNSGYIVTQDHEHDSKLLFSAHSRRIPFPLGSRSLHASEIEAHIHELTLGTSGLYRVRTFSDGVFGADHSAHLFLLNERSGIEELVETARAWPSTYPQIGGDDWAVAGMDLVITAPAASAAGTFELAPADSKADTAAYSWSSEARRFWWDTADRDAEIGSVIRETIPGIFDQGRPMSTYSPIPVPQKAAQPPQTSSPKFKIEFEKDYEPLRVVMLHGLGTWTTSHLGYTPADLRRDERGRLPSIDFATFDDARDSVLRSRSLSAQARDVVLLRETSRPWRFTVLGLFVAIAFSIGTVVPLPWTKDESWRVVEVAGRAELQTSSGTWSTVRSGPAPSNGVVPRTFRSLQDADTYFQSTVAAVVPKKPEAEVPQPPSEPEFVGVTVQEGDTLLGIAQRYKMSLRDILHANPQLGEGKVIHVGSTVQVRNPRRR